MIGQIKNRVLNMIARAVLDKTTVEDDSTVTTKQTILSGEARDNVDLYQHYGFASVPLTDAEAITVFLGGDRSSGVTIATEDARYRVQNMQNGEVAIYTDEGDMVYLRRGRQIEIKTGTLTAQADIRATITAPTVEIDAPMVTMSGNLSVTGTITAAAVSAGGIAATGSAGVADATGTLADTRSALEDLDMSYSVHVHGGVTSGPAVTSGPVAP